MEDPLENYVVHQIRKFFLILFLALPYFTGLIIHDAIRNRNVHPVDFPLLLTFLGYTALIAFLIAMKEENETFLTLRIKTAKALLAISLLSGFSTGIAIRHLN